VHIKQITKEGQQVHTVAKHAHMLIPSTEQPVCTAVLLGLHTMIDKRYI